MGPQGPQEGTGGTPRGTGTPPRGPGTPPEPPGDTPRAPRDISGKNDFFRSRAFLAGAFFPPKTDIPPDFRQKPGFLVKKKKVEIWRFWTHSEYRGTCPVIFLKFTGVEKS